ncbi:mitochondrial import inner membrane translocase subunit TIM44-like [Brachyhypopomus gauderio]|uniref:mitochondrial import inner membrane translocase subunit TIM44-like n=1 Tax=Brachyhypopomus gauderio TaxID=698409 RepID=UPI0040434DA6
MAHASARSVLRSPGEEQHLQVHLPETTGVVLHKDSKWYQQWTDFRDNNVVFNRGLVSKTEISTVLTEILRADPTFDKESFLQQCQRDIIPNVLQALIRGELEILKDWCYKAVYSQVSHPIKQAIGMGLQLHSKVLDIDNIDEKVLRMMYVWALCREQEELNPHADWRLVDISASSTEHVI